MKNNASRFLAIAVVGLALMTSIRMAFASAQEWGNVLPGDAHPHGYSLTDMLIASAVFSFGGSNPTKIPIPNTPFQILFADLNHVTFTSLPCGGVTVHGHGFYSPFVVKSGTLFYVPLIGMDDSPPVLVLSPPLVEWPWIIFSSRTNWAVKTG